MGAPTGTEAAQREEAPLPAPRQETAAAVLDGKLYVIAGFDSEGKGTSTTFVTDGKGWQSGPSLPAVLDHPSAASIGRRLYLAGGYSNGAASEKVYVLSTAGDAWQPASPMRHARGALALVAVGNNLFALGGTNGKDEVAAGELYDTAAQVWRDLPDMPHPRDHLAGFAHQNMPCVAGGRTPNTARVDCFDSRALAWRQLPDLPVPTSGAGAAALANDVLVAGGEPVNEPGPNVDMLARLVKGNWRVGKMYLPRHGIQLAVLNGRAWACGGGASPGYDAVAGCTSIP